MKLSSTISLKLVLGLAALASPMTMQARTLTNKELVIGVSQEFGHLNAMVNEMSATSYVYALTNRTLVTLNPDSTWVPLLVTQIPTFENGLAKKTVENGREVIISQWEIHKDASWGDGTPVTGEDVKFSRELALTETIGVGEREIYSDIYEIQVDKQNPKKFTFIQKPKWDFATLGTYYIVPKHLEGPILEKNKKIAQGYEKNSKYVTDPTNPGLYNGPYLVKEVKLGSHITLVRNPKFFGKKPNIESITIKYIANNATLEPNLFAGSIDMIADLGVTLDQAVEIEKKVTKDNLPYTVNMIPGLTYEHIDLNLDNEILKDVNVRRALLHAINREDLVKSLFFGRQIVAHHYVPKADKEWYTEDPKHIAIYEPSRRKAASLLEAAGWKLGPDNFRYKDGKKLSLQIMTTSGNKVRELVETYLQEQYKQVGIELTVKNEPARVFFSETTKQRKFPHMAMYAWSSSPQNSPRSTLHSKSIPTAKNGFSGQNTPGWVNKEFDATIDALELEFDPAKRVQLAYKLSGLYTQDVPVLPLYYRNAISITPKAMKGYRLSPNQFHETLFAENWDLGGGAATN